MADDVKPKLRLLDKQEVCDRVHRSYPSVWELMCKGRFPRAVEQGERVYWFEHQIDAYLEALPLRDIKSGMPAQLNVSDNPRRRGRSRTANPKL